MAKLPSPSSPSHWETGEAVGGRRRPWDPTSQATAAAGEEGERGSGVQGFDSPSHLGLRCGEEAGQREQAAAAAALGGSGGGARKLGEKRHGAV